MTVGRWRADWARWALGALGSLVGCSQDPQLDAWHGAIAVETVEATAADGCDAERAPVDPPAPYLFVAVDRGVPDIASLYWCDEADACGAPADTVWLTEALTERHLAGALTTVLPFAGLCAIEWVDVVADQQGDPASVSLVVRSGQFEDLALDEDDCYAYADGVAGDVCTSVVAVSGTRVP
ncbi:MAG: hypothetical protein ABMB14_00395 [Myxococcota bacterium]